MWQHLWGREGQLWPPKEVAGKRCSFWHGHNQNPSSSLFTLSLYQLCVNVPILAVCRKFVDMNLIWQPSLLQVSRSPIWSPLRRFDPYWEHSEFFLFKCACVIHWMMSSLRISVVLECLTTLSTTNILSTH